MIENELSVFRTENKYLISYNDSIKMIEQLDKLIYRDVNSKQQSYIVRSLYFDSINNIDFNTKLAGTSERKKIRLRVYDSKSSKCKLEMKEKHGELQHKTSIWITKEDAISLSNCDYSVLTKYFDSSESAIKIYKTMILGCYKPVVLIEYLRTAFMYPNYDTRITFDSYIKSSESNFNLFDDSPIYVDIFSSNVVLEVKYNEKLMGFISQILKKYNLNKQAISKYCMGRKDLYSF